MHTYSDLLQVQNLSLTNRFDEGKSQRRWIQRLVNNLVFALQIPEGDHLTFVLGFGECESNYQALYAWVEEQVALSHVLEREAGNAFFESLKAELAHVLNTAWDGVFFEGGL